MAKHTRALKVTEEDKPIFVCTQQGSYLVGRKKIFYLFSWPNADSGKKNPTNLVCILKYAAKLERSINASQERVVFPVGNTNSISY